jgi:hypothetical protein
MATVATASSLEGMSTCFVLGRNEYGGQTEGAPCAPQLTSVELSTAQQRSAAAAHGRAASSAGPRTLPSPRQADHLLFLLSSPPGPKRAKARNFRFFEIRRL